jgi:hypothetical protein
MIDGVKAIFDASSQIGGLPNSPMVKFQSYT